MKTKLYKGWYQLSETQDSRKYHCDCEPPKNVILNPEVKLNAKGRKWNEGRFQVVEGKFKGDIFYDHHL